MKRDLGFGPELAASKPERRGNLCCQRPLWLTLAQDKLAAAVFAAYGWDPSMSDDHLLESRLALNLGRGTVAAPDRLGLGGG
jgi:anti-sigma factor RsiW